MSKFLGIVVTPPAIQSEGLQSVMDKIVATGAQAICTAPSLASPSPPGVGMRTPPLDIDGNERLLDRPLWGKRELWLQGYSTFEPDESLYHGRTPYRPRTTLAPHDRNLVHDILQEARRRGLQAHLQVSPTIVPGLSDADQVRYIDGSILPPSKRVARQGCLNNPAVREYGLALLRDTIRHYPEADGMFVDWVEYTTYGLEDWFGCTCAHCARQAAAWGYDWDTITRDLRATWDAFHGLNSRQLERARRAVSHPAALLDMLQRHPGWLAFWRFKAQTVAETFRRYRQVIDEEGDQIELGANGWCPPFNLSSGMDFRGVAQSVQSVRMKLFTFHWSVIPRWYGQTLLQWNPQLAERQVLDALVECLDLPDGIEPRSFADYNIPAPEEDHPAKPQSWRAKMDQVVDQVAGRAACYAYAHSYRSQAQWKRMIAVLRDSRADGMWVQRYGYLSDSKLDALATMWR